MAITFIPGHLTAITIDGDDYTVTSGTLGFSGAKNTPRKAVFGAGTSRVISGQRSWSGSLSGHIAAEEPLANLLATFASDVPVPFSAQVGELSGTTDGGILAGDAVVASLEITSDVEGEWDYSLTLEVDGDLSHTPPA